MTYKSLVKKHGVVAASKLWKKAKKAGKSKTKKSVARGKIVTFMSKGRKVAFKTKTAKKPAKKLSKKTAKRTAKRTAKASEYRKLVAKYGVKKASAMYREGKFGTYTPVRQPSTFKQYVKMYGVKRGAKLYQEQNRDANFGMYTPKYESPASDDGAYGTTQWSKEVDPWDARYQAKVDSLPGRMRRRRSGRMAGYLAPGY